MEIRTETRFPVGVGVSSLASRIRRRKRKISDSVLWQKPLYQQKIQNTNWQHQHANKKFTYTIIADRFGTAGWSNNIHPTGVVKPVYGYPTYEAT